MNKIKNDKSIVIYILFAAVVFMFLVIIILSFKVTKIEENLDGAKFNCEETTFNRYINISNRQIPLNKFGNGTMICDKDNCIYVEKYNHCEVI